MIAARRPGYVLSLLLPDAATALAVDHGAAGPDAKWRLLDLWPLLLVMISAQMVAVRAVPGRAGRFSPSCWSPRSRAAGWTTRWPNAQPAGGGSPGVDVVDAAAGQVSATAAGLGVRLGTGEVRYAVGAPQVTGSDGYVRVSTGRSGWFGTSRANGATS